MGILYNRILFSEFLMTSFTYELCEVASCKMAPAHCTGLRQMPVNIVIYCHDSEYCCELLSGERFIAQPGETIVLPADVPHKMTAHTKLLHSFIHIRYSFFEAFNVLDLYDTPRIIRGESSRRIMALIDTVSRSLPGTERHGFPFSEMLVQREAVYSLLNTIIAESSLKQTSPELLISIAKMHPVLTYIQNNYSTIANRAELASVMNHSETRFHYIFKEILGVAPMKYLQDLRLKKAQILLISSDLPVSIIAKNIGYGDAFNFSRQFKKAVGTSPMEYRRNNMMMASFLR